MPGKNRFPGMGLQPAHKRHTRCRAQIKFYWELREVLLMGSSRHKPWGAMSHTIFMPLSDVNLDVLPPLGLVYYASQPL